MFKYKIKEKNLNLSQMSDTYLTASFIRFQNKTKFLLKIHCF